MYERMLEVLRAGKGKPPRWKAGVEVFEWWMESREIKGQIDIEEYQTLYREGGID